MLASPNVIFNANYAQFALPAPGMFPNVTTAIFVLAPAARWSLEDFVAELVNQS